MSQQHSADELTPLRRETRWPILLSVVVVVVLTTLRPSELRFTPIWLLPGIELLLLFALVAAHPSEPGRHATFLRTVMIIVVAVVLFDTTTATVRLIDALIHGGKAINSADLLLASGGIVWSSNIIAFALLYWLFDAGGPATRARRMPQALDLAFPQQLSPEIAPLGWRPKFIDYLYLGLTASTAFSPTDVMPLVPWAKVAMGLQSLVSIVVIGLIVARAVNVLT